MSSKLPKIISVEKFNKFDPSYQKVILQLEQAIEDCETNLEINPSEYDPECIRIYKKLNKDAKKWYKRILIIEKFAESYLMPGEYWTYLHISCENSDCSSRDKYLEINWKAYYHLFYDRKEGCLDEFENHKPKRLTILKFDRGFMIKNGEYYAFPEQKLAFDISFPHKYLEEVFKVYQRECTTAPTREILQNYKKMKNLYDKIKAAEDRNCSVDEWISLLLEAGNHEFVVHNIEYRLGMDLTDKALWLLYFDYLEKHDPKEMLQLYSKYCRFFLDDTVMKEKYKEAVTKYGQSCVSWKNKFLFESMVPKPKNFSAYQNRWNIAPSTAQKKFLSIDVNLLKNYFQTCQSQTFAFSKPIINYIIKTVNPTVLQKLFFSCKYFFFKKQTPICRKFSASSWEDEFIGESLMMSRNAKPFLRNTHITTSFKALICGSTIDAQNYVSSFLPNIYQCDAKLVNITEQNLSKKELLFLIGHGNVEDLTLCGVTVKDENGEDFNQLEEYMKLLPNIERLELVVLHVNPNTATALANLKFNTKIHSLKLIYIIGDPFDLNDLINYFNINRTKHFNVNLQFQSFHEDFNNMCKTTLKNYLEATKHTNIVLNYRSLSHEDDDE